jgi:hypothetical protein
MYLHSLPFMIQMQPRKIAPLDVEFKRSLRRNLTHIHTSVPCEHHKLTFIFLPSEEQPSSKIKAYFLEEVITFILSSQ